MKLGFFVLIGIMTVLLSAFYVTDSIQNPNFEVFAQSVEKNKNFEDAVATHSSETNTNLNSNSTQVNTTANSTETNTNLNPNSNSTQILEIDESVQSQSNQTSTKIENKDNDNTHFIGRSSVSENTKIHPAITQILNHANPKSMAKIFDASIDGDQLYVYVHLDDKKIQNKPLDIEILAQDKNIIVSKLSLNQIKSLANSEYVKRITLPVKAVTFDHGESEGISFSMADEMHAAGFTGTGIKVAVIDTSFFPNNTEIANNVLNATLFDFTNKCSGNITCGKITISSHGTAVAEIVVDMAPDVDLLLYTIKSSVDFANAVDDALSNGADIITASLGCPGVGGDGITGL